MVKLSLYKVSFVVYGVKFESARYFHCRKHVADQYVTTQKTKGIKHYLYILSSFEYVIFTYFTLCKHIIDQWLYGMKPICNARDNISNNQVLITPFVLFEICHNVDNYSFILDVI